VSSDEPTKAEKKAYRVALYEGQALAMKSLIEHFGRLETQAREGTRGVTTDVAAQAAYCRGLGDAFALAARCAHTLLLDAQKESGNG